MNMWTKNFVSNLGRLVVRGMVRWLELLGQNPPLSRDHGFLAWQYLHPEKGREQPRAQGPSGVKGVLVPFPPLPPRAISQKAPACHL
jgi:hypothetical protein